MRTLNAAILILVMTLAGGVQGQETGGSLEGALVDPGGQPVPGARILVTGPNLMGSQSRVSNDNGRFAFHALPVGTFDLKIAAGGFHTLHVRGLAVRLGGRTNAGILVLQPRTTMIEDLVVIANSALVDPRSTIGGGNLLAEEFATLPVDRSYRGLATLLPQVQPSFLGDDVNFAGGTGMENGWFVDGMEVTDPVFNNGAMDLPYNFVRQVQVRTGGFQAEFRGSQGGVVNVVTHSGSNRRQVEAFGFWLDDQFQATPLEGVQDPELGGFSRWDVGAGTGGPFIKDKIWYFAAYNPAFDSQETGIPGQGTTLDENTTHRFAGKVDWRAGERHDLTLSLAGNPRRGDIAFFPVVAGIPSGYLNPDPVLITRKTGTIASSLTGRHYLGDNSLLESSISFVWNRNTWSPRTARGAEEIMYFDHGSDLVSGGTMFADGANWIHGLDTAFGVKATLPLGPHTWKFGAEYRRNRAKIKDDTSLLQSFPNPESGEDDFFLLEMRTHGTVADRMPSAFIQDEWILNDHLRLQAGLRWDGQYLENSDGDITVRLNDQWQPRAGFVWTPGADGKSKVTGSWGRFYQAISLWAPGQTLIRDATATMTWYDHDPRNDHSGGSVVWNSDVTIIDDLRGQHQDEWTLGYERTLDGRSSVGIRGIFRELREVIEDAPSRLQDGRFVWGNPGRGLLAEFPRAKREYSAFEVTYQLNGTDGNHLLASYTLSRNRGNTSGIFGSDFGGGNPNYSLQWDTMSWTVNGHGLLPNDRPHALKFAGAVESTPWLTVGGTLSWLSGTPLNEFGPDHVFLVPRGSAGRTSPVWDFSVRLTLKPGRRGTWAEDAKLLVDFLHIGSPRKATNVDQWHYLSFAEDGTPTGANPTYGMATSYQPPFALRLGAVMNF
ncbi:TonB-dependent receptor [bacterium]|nr:TonB-dependent receptor [bacterium]